VAQFRKEIQLQRIKFSETGGSSVQLPKKLFPIENVPQGHDMVNSTEYSQMAFMRKE